MRFLFMSIVETIYNSSPIFIQNVMCSLYGLKLYRERYSGKWKDYYKQLLLSQYFDRNQLEDHQRVALKNTVLQALKYVPYYKESDNYKIDYNAIKDISDLRKLPILEKKTLRKFNDHFISEKFKNDKLIKVNTSGTTGTPITVYLSKDARKMNYAFFARSKKWAGIEGFEKNITFAGRTIVSPLQTKPPFWRKNIITNNTLFSSYHISMENSQAYINQIKRVKPVFIDSYPSSIFNLATNMVKNNIKINVKSIITSAETLFEHQREIIEKAFNCKVYDQYGSAEQVVFACQCEYGKYHLNSEYGILEVLDDDNNPVKIGETGNFICTGFTNPAMPLLRFKIGDKGSLTDEVCKCGRNFPVIAKIEGREDDTLITPDGRYIGRLDPIFKGLENTIIETQIIQKTIDLIVIKIVKTPEYKNDHGNFIINELKKRMGTNINYRIEYVDKIIRTRSGKFRAVISEINKHDLNH